jgi:hypothetical protein
VVERLPYKEEVAGSNPASPTLIKRCFAGKTWEMLAELRDGQPLPDTNLTPTRKT